MQIYLRLIYNENIPPLEGIITDQLLQYGKYL